MVSSLLHVIGSTKEHRIHGTNQIIPQEQHAQPWLEPVTWKCMLDGNFSLEMTQEGQRDPTKPWP